MRIYFFYIVCSDKVLVQNKDGYMTTSKKTLIEILQNGTFSEDTILQVIKFLRAQSAMQENIQRTLESLSQSMVNDKKTSALTKLITLEKDIDLWEKALLEEGTHFSSFAFEAARTLPMLCEQHCERESLIDGPACSVDRCGEKRFAKFLMAFVKQGNNLLKPLQSKDAVVERVHKIFEYSKNLVEKYAKNKNDATVLEQFLRDIREDYLLEYAGICLSKDVLKGKTFEQVLNHCIEEYNRYQENANA